jgi:hypothetical protein
MDNRRTQQKNRKVELHTQFWRQASPENWDFPSKNDSSNHFSVDSLGTLEYFPSFRTLFIGKSLNTTKKFKNQAPHSVLVAGELKELGFSFKKTIVVTIDSDSLYRLTSAYYTITPEPLHYL